MADGFDVTELTKFEKQLLDVAQVKMPKEIRKFMRDEGNLLKKKTKAEANQLVKKGTGDEPPSYHKSIKRGKVYVYKGNGGMAVRVISSDPKAHLLEYGHRQVVNPGKGSGGGKGVIPGKGIGKEVGFVPGLHVFEKAAKGFDSEFKEDAQQFIDALLDGGLS